MPFVNAYVRALGSLIRRTASLGREVDRMLADALTALELQDRILAQAILERDDYVDDEDAGIEQDALELISLQQPRQEDLRMMAGLLRVGRDLERVADYSCDIAEVALALADESYYKPLNDLPRLGQMAREMLKQAIIALETHNSDLAKRVNDADDAVDALYVSLYQELVTAMEDNPKIIRQASHLALVARYLERIADHAVNVAEMTVFAVEGRRRPFHHGQSAAQGRD